MPISLPIVSIGGACASGGYNIMQVKSSLSSACCSQPALGPAVSQSATRKPNYISHGYCLAASSSHSPARCSSILRLPSNADLNSFQMPPLHCTFPSLLHPHYEAVKERCDAWIERLVQPPSAAARRFLHDCLLPRLICLFIPNAPAEPRLIHVIKLISWLMIADDDNDHLDARRSDYAATADRADLIIEILGKVDNDGGADEGSSDRSFLTNIGPSKSARMLKALAEVWDEIRQEMSPTLQARFISTMANYFEGIKVQASVYKHVCVPDKESYMGICRQASFTIPSFVLVEYALGIELDEATFHNPLIQELRNVVLDYISLCNDIVSCCIEISMGDYFNLPFILYAHSPYKFTSFQNAVDHVAQMTEELNTRAISLISIIHKESKHFEPHMVPLVNAYVDALSFGMSGALTWFFETARYRQPLARTKLYLQEVHLKSI